MTHRTVICVLLVVFVATTPACARAAEDDAPPTPTAEAPASPVEAALEPSPEPSPEPSASHEESEPFVEAAVISSPRPYTGATTLEERIVNADAIVRADLISFQAVAEALHPQLNNPAHTSYEGMLEFTFLVLEWIVGSGPNEITVVVPTFGVQKTQAQAESILPGIATLHNTRWDERDAILFLKNSHYAVPSTNRADRFFFTIYDVAYPYSIESLWDKLWLPAAQVHSFLSTGEYFTAETIDHMEFLLDEPRPMTEADLKPPPVGDPIPIEHAPTITLGDFKTKVAVLRAEMNAGGTEDHKLCVQGKYGHQRWLAHQLKAIPGFEYDGSNQSPPNTHSFESGVAAGSVVHEDETGTGPNDVWLDGSDIDLFNADPISLTRRVTATRPLPKGTYTFFFNHTFGIGRLCEGYYIRYKWTVNVTAPEGTLHEAFFDPLTNVSAIAADATNGQLAPASFTDPNGASATIHRISYDSSGVTLTLTPHTAITGHTLDFIALDGSISLSLHADDATPDPDNNALTWPVPNQPWHPGDKLMLRIYQANP